LAPMAAVACTRGNNARAVRRFGESGRLGKSAPQILPSFPARAGSLAAEQGHSPSRGSGVRVGGVPGGEDLPPLTEAAGGQVTRSRPYPRPSPRHAPAGRSSNGAAGHADRPSGAGDVGVGGEFAAAVRAGEPHHQAAPRPAVLTPVSERAVGAGSRNRRFRSGAADTNHLCASLC